MHASITSTKQTETKYHQPNSQILNGTQESHQRCANNSNHNPKHHYPNHKPNNKNDKNEKQHKNKSPAYAEICKQHNTKHQKQEKQEKTKTNTKWNLNAKSYYVFINIDICDNYNNHHYNMV